MARRGGLEGEFSMSCDIVVTPTASRDGGTGGETSMSLQRRGGMASSSRTKASRESGSLRLFTDNRGITL